MDRTLHQLTVLAASGVIMLIALSAGLSSTHSNYGSQVTQPTTAIAENLNR
ncbi:hypothetical protein [Gloeothece verrucosa]|uniref:Uncharacterized protein n=1 Tax=Gloeothece verrucosa (strain PCC 7822) TaxID=497965 RepID=E0U789_GLOV7|nr:hypothetical protein [Gloeothece verrucosa]ADN12476.1 hypothetical protein Cyan7822_0431 [Gloeothece verrucosa PCC 7822]